MRTVRVLLTAFIVVILDQITKYFARLYEPSSGILTYVENTGAAFGIFQNQSLLLGLIGLVVAIIVVAYIRAIPKKDLLPQFGLGLFLGGTVGNMIDRLVFGFVTDFVNFQVWPVFNVADVANVVGVLILVYYFWKN